MEVIAIIPARGGSKRIPRKNIKEFFGQPIIKYSIDAAIASGIFSEVMVSTDDQEIAAVAKKYSAKVPFMRSAKTADDYATIPDVIIEVLNEYQKLNREFDYAFCLYPTNPFIKPGALKQALDKLVTTGADSILPITRFSYPIKRSLKINSNGTLEMNWPEHTRTRSQDLEPAYHDTGQYFGVATKNFMDNKQFFTTKTVPILVSDLESHDIDTEEDWLAAEIKYQLLNELTKKQHEKNI